MRTHKILKIPSLDILQQEILSRELGISKILSQLLINRGAGEPRQAEKFLNISTKDLFDPFLFTDMSRAVGLVRQALAKKEKVMIFGDYDVDGLTALALLKESLGRLGIEAEHYLPHRVNEGYGLSDRIPQICRDKGTRLLITVDCGITSTEEISSLRRHGVEVIITDHHEPQSEKLPPASAIINPKLKNSNYKFRDLAGVGVAYKFAQALNDSPLLDELDLVSLGTIADVVPLLGENRVIAKEGLRIFPRTRRPGLRALIENAGIANKKFNSTYINFIIAPRINASGRMDSSEASLELLLTDSTRRALELARTLEAYNRQRQQVESKIMDEAQRIIDKEVNFKEHKVIVISNEGWHKGVLGIVASKITDRFYRPTIVISLDGKLCKGSGRSIKNFHLFEALLECRGLLDGFGGHAHAAGLLVSRDRIKDFRNTINRLAHEKLKIDDLLPSQEVDMELGLQDLSQELVEELERLEPYGQDNPEPLFYTRALKLKGQPQSLGRETLKFWATDGAVTYQAIGFGLAGLKDSLLSGESFDLIYNPRLDTWRDNNSIVLEIRDIFLR